MKKAIKTVLIFTMLFCVVFAVMGCAAVGDETANAITLEAVSVVLDIAASAAVALIGIAGAWLAAKVGQNKNLSNISEAIKQVVQAAQLTVGELQQTTVSALKAATADGKLTESQIAALKEQLLRKTREKLTSPVMQLLEASKMDVNALIRGAAEDLINNIHTTEQLIAGEVILE